MNIPSTHHYIPVFYSKRWASDNPAQLLRFSLWPGGHFSSERKSPKGVGWQENGYSFEGFSGAEAEVVETGLMKPNDDRAGKILHRLETSGVAGDWSSDDRYAWTWLIVSLLLRGPEDVMSAKKHISTDWANPTDQVEARYQKLRHDFPMMPLPPTMKEYLASKDADYGSRLGVKIMADMTAHGGISAMIADMHWGVRLITGEQLFMTSDRPVRREYPLRSRRAFITMPLGPKCIFLASKTSEGLARLMKRPEPHLVSENNKVLVRQARQFVFAYDDRDREWVKRNIAKEPQPAFFDFIGRFGAGAASSARKRMNR
jgi:hypothetical protein